MSKTLKQLAREAIDIQSACNMLGLANSFSNTLYDLNRHVPTGEIRNHPITRLWTSKLHDLSNMGVSDTEAYGKAYAACSVLAEGGEAQQ